MKHLLILTSLLISGSLWAEEDLLLKCDGFGRGSSMSVIINISEEDSWIETPNRLTNINNNTASTEQQLQRKKRSLQDIEITDERIKADFKIRFAQWAKIIIDRFEGSIVIGQKRFRFEGDCRPYESEPKQRKF